jgi:hypothetical protein
MKIRVQKISREQASALIVTLVLGVVLLVVLASYMGLLASQKKLVTRSQTWNAALTMAEAGIEEGMAQLNQGTSFSFTNLFNNSTITNFSNNGWGGSGTNFGPKGANLLGGSYKASIIALPANGLLTTATVYSTGYTTVPITGDTISRKIKVIALTMPLFNVGVGAVSNVTYTGGGGGNNIGVDSYYSHPQTNTGVTVPYSSSIALSNGNVASQYGFVNFANQQIDGNLYLGPNATTSGSNNITGAVSYNWNVQFPDVTLPPGANSWTTAGTTNTTVNTYKNNGNVQTTVRSAYDFQVSGNYIVNQDLPIIVEAGVTVNINYTGSTYSGTGINLNGSGTNTGTAVIFFNGPSTVTIGGNIAINPTGTPQNLVYYGLPSLTSITYGGNTAFVGVIYSPEANMTLNGGGNSSDISGSVIVNSISDKGHYNIHYDQDLAINGPSRGFVAYVWQEL